MEIEPKEIAGLITFAGGLASVWFGMKYKQERLAEKDNEQAIQILEIRTQSKKEIEEIWKWKNSHERDAMAARENFNRELAELKGALLVTGEQYKQVISLLQDIKDRVMELEKK